jgi:hypothetical protein
LIAGKRPLLFNPEMNTPHCFMNRHDCQLNAKDEAGVFISRTAKTT